MPKVKLTLKMFHVESYCGHGDELSIVLVLEKTHNRRFATVIEPNYQNANLLGLSILP